jgi:hypothetical protein
VPLESAYEIEIKLRPSKIPIILDFPQFCPKQVDKVDCGGEVGGVT